MKFELLLECPLIGRHWIPRNLTVSNIFIRQCLASFLACADWLLTILKTFISLTAEIMIRQLVDAYCIFHEFLIFPIRETFLNKCFVRKLITVTGIRTFDFILIVRLSTHGTKYFIVFFYILYPLKIIRPFRQIFSRIWFRCWFWYIPGYTCYSKFFYLCRLLICICKGCTFIASMSWSLRFYFIN